RAHVCPFPAATATLGGRWDTTTGNLLLSKFPLPSCPVAFSPQHLTTPLALTAHVWLIPPANATMPVSGRSHVASAHTRAGVLLVPSGAVSLPSWPFVFSPQHLTSP